MPKKITKLTQAQKDRIPEWVDKWVKIGLRTGETDWDTFDKYMPICFQKAGLEYPKRVVRVASPLVGAIASSIANKLLRSVAVGGAVDDAVDGVVNDAVDDAVHDAVDGVVGGVVDGVVSGAVGVAVHGVVSGVVSDAVDDAVHGVVGGVVSDAVDGAKLPWHYWLGGQFWVGGWWGSPAFVSFFTEVCGLKLDKDIQERAEAYQKVCESVNYVWPNKNFVMVCERPKVIHRNNRGQLHYEHGKAIEYSDGWGVYVLNGVRFSEELYLRVISREMTMEDVLKITDIDQRIQAIKFAKVGVREFYISQNGKKIDEYIKFDAMGRMVKYELWEIPSGEVFSKTVKFAIYDCPSALARGEKREYTKGVPVECNTVAEAMSWGMSSDEYVVTPEQFKSLVPLVDES